MAASKRLFFPNLDGLRFVAFFMVFLWHTIRRPFELLEVNNIYLKKLFYLFVNGKTGVSIFFVLSLAVSYFSYHLVEAWLLKLKDRFSFIHKQ
jgi:peptidoglycan/LPS O-acetylase OafA/YrhL